MRDINAASNPKVVILLTVSYTYHNDTMKDYTVSIITFALLLFSLLFTVIVQKLVNQTLTFSLMS